VRRGDRTAERLHCRRKAFRQPRTQHHVLDMQPADDGEQLLLRDTERRRIRAFHHGTPSSRPVAPWALALEPRRQYSERLRRSPTTTRHDPRLALCPESELGRCQIHQTAAATSVAMVNAMSGCPSSSGCGSPRRRAGRSRRPGPAAPASHPLFSAPAGGYRAAARRWHGAGTRWRHAIAGHRGSAGEERPPAYNAHTSLLRA
jgi:hypothetical protein